MTPLERYLAKIAPPNDRGCRLWTHGCFKDGYGKFWAEYKTVQAHRWGYHTLIGPIPEGMQVLHHCDEPACQTPEHWFLGTNSDNMADKTAKNRQAKGEELGPKCKLTPNEVIEIREQHALGSTITLLSQTYGISRRQVKRIIDHEKWAHLAA